MQNKAAILQFKRGITMENQQTKGNILLLGIIALCIAGIVWYLLASKKEFHKQKNELIQTLEWQNESRIKVYQSIRKLRKMFESECQKKSQDIDLYVLISIRDDIIKQNPEFFSRNHHPEWKYHKGWEVPIQISGPLSELETDIHDVNLEQIQKIYNEIQFQKQGLDTTQTYEQIRQLQQLFLQKKFLLEDLVYVRNEIMKHYDFHFKLDLTTKWSQHSKTEIFTIHGPFDVHGKKIQ
jgi:hypothetical protein